MEEVIGISSALILLLGWFWNDIEHTFKNIRGINKKITSNKNKIDSTSSIRITSIDEGKYGASSDGIIDDYDDDGAGARISNINMLTEDQILGRFPPETLIKYKGVSSCWRHLIVELCNHQLIPKDRYPFSGFIFSVGFLGYSSRRGLWYCHGRRSSSQKKLIGAENQLEIVARSFLAPLPGPSSPHENREFLDCCNGLLLFRQSSVYTTPKYIVCNPTTSECVEIIGKTFDTTHDAIGALAFNPSESNHYKVVLIPNRQGCAHLKIFSSETQKWTESKFHLQKELNLERTQSVFFKGTLFKLSLTGHIMRIFINWQQVSKIDRVQSIDPPLARNLLLPGCIRGECLGLHNGDILQYAFFNGKELRIFTLEHTSGNIYGSLNKDDFYWSLKHNIYFKFTNNFPKPSERNPWTYGFYPDSDVMNPWIYGFYPDSDVIVMGFRNDNSRFFIHCYNYILQRIDEHAQSLNSKVSQCDNLLVFPFARCFLSLPKFNSEAVCDEDQNFGNKMSSRYSKGIICKSDGFYLNSAVICNLTPIAYL